MNRRDQVIDLLGLQPRWRLRTPTTLELHATQEASQEQLEPATTTQSWTSLQEEVAHCTRCGLCESRTQTVFGRGSPSARWLLVGEAPGEQEDRQGLPFVGAAGQLLENILAAIGLNSATDVYIANVLKCRPPGNRNPQENEIAACHPYLAAQIAHLRPTLIVALGRFAAQTLLVSKASISALRGQVHQYDTTPLIVTYHPAYLLRNLPEKAKAWEDWCFAKQTFFTTTRG